MPRDAAVRAWKVGDPFDDEGRQVVVYATKRSEAKAFAQGELNAEYIDLEAHRAPEFDGLGGDELIRAQLAAGWWMGCYGCYEPVRAEEEEGEVYDECHRAAPYVLRNGAVYCSSKCCLKQLRKERDSRMATWTAVADAMGRWPGIEILHVWASIGGVSLTFKFPGGEFPIDWNYGESEVRAIESDVEAWERYAAPLRAARKA